MCRRELAVAAMTVQIADPLRQDLKQQGRCRERHPICAVTTQVQLEIVIVEALVSIAASVAKKG